MDARGIAAVVVAGALGVLVAPVGAQPDDEVGPIEIEDQIGDGSGSGSGSDAPAEPPAVVKDPKAAARALATARRELARGDYYTRKNRPDDARTHYEAAHAAFQQAIDLGDDVGVIYDLAIAEDKLGQPDVAARHWRALTKAAGVKPEIVQKATAKYEEVLAKLGLVSFNVLPEGATISLDGNVVGTAPLPEPLILLPNTYTFQIASDGFKPQDVEVKVEAGSESERGITLEPVELVIAPPKPPVVDEEPVAPPPPAPSKLPLYIGGGATLALATTATITGILAIGKHGTFTSDDASASERADARSQGQRLAHITDATLIGAAIAGGFTAYWYVYKYRRAKRGHETAKVGLVPWVQPSVARSAGGLSLSGSF